MTAAQEINQSKAGQARTRPGARCIDRLTSGQQHRRIDGDGGGAIGVVAAAQDRKRDAPTLGLGDDRRTHGERRGVAIGCRQPRRDGEPTEQLRPFDRGQERLRCHVGTRGISQVFRWQDAVDPRRRCVRGTDRITNPRRSLRSIVRTRV